MRNWVIHPVRGRRRAGVASLIAMLYVTLFATLAVAFYAATTMSAQMSRNDRVVAQTQLAAESGLGFARRQLTVANVTPSTDPATTFSTLYSKLTTQCGSSANMGGFAPTRFTTSGGVDTICVPGHSGTSAAPAYNWMSLGGTGGQARITLTRSGTDVVVTAYGRNSAADPIARAVQMTYKSASGAWAPPAAGILTRSPVTMSNAATILGGDVVSATAQANTAALSLTGGARIAQNFYYTTNPKPPVINNGGQVSGTIYANVAMPSFPTVDTTAFAAFVPSATAAAGPKVLTATSSIASGAVLTNIRIKANANLTFQNNVQLNGVIYIESPNKITIASVQSVNGIIVTDNDTTKPLSGNTLTINNGALVRGLETLNAANFAASENIATLKTMAGALVLAPNYKVTIAGGAQTFNGTMVASSWDISNGYRGTINGSLINLADTAFTMVGGGQITFTGGGTAVPGLGGGAALTVDLGSYLEVAP